MTAAELVQTTSAPSAVIVYNVQVLRRPGGILQENFLERPTSNE